MYSVVFCISPIDFYERYEYYQTDILQIIHRLKRKTVKSNSKENIVNTTKVYRNIILHHLAWIMNRKEHKM